MYDVGKALQKEMVRKRVFLRHLYIKMIILPRQARDKHRENSIGDAFLQDKVASKPCGQFSGGMKRRLSVAISLIGSPTVVFMDEPSTGAYRICTPLPAHPPAHTKPTQHTTSGIHGVEVFKCDS